MVRLGKSSRDALQVVIFPAADDEGGGPRPGQGIAFVRLTPVVTKCGRAQDHVLNAWAFLWRGLET